MRADDRPKAGSVLGDAVQGASQTQAAAEPSTWGSAPHPDSWGASHAGRTGPSREARIDLFTPWREPDAAVQRHMGRQQELTALEAACRGFLSGSNPLPIYVYGGRGVGKSHLLTVLVERVRAAWEEAGGQVLAVGEDLPEHRDAGALLNRALGLTTTPWDAWSARVPVAEGVPLLLVLEGFDRHAHALGPSGRRELRRLLAERPNLYLVASGATLPDVLTGTDEAFRGHFAVWPLAPLEPDDASALLDRLVPELVRAESRWAGRQSALLAVSAGSPRALAALSIALLRDDAADVAGAIGEVLSAMTPHYQLRLRDLSAQQQQIADLLARAPRELGAVDLAQALGVESSPMGTQCRRMVDDGVLADRVDGHRTFFRLAEPLFRFWLEGRAAPWHEARTAFVSRVIEAMWSAREIVAAWADSGDELVREAVERAIERNPKLRAEGVWEAHRRGIEACGRRAVPDLNKALDMLARLGKVDFVVESLCARALGSRALGSPSPWHQGLDLLHAEFPRVRVVAAARELARAVSLGDRPKEALVQLAPHVARSPYPLLLATAALEALEGLTPQGARWVLRDRERRALAAAPFLRTAFLRRGRRATHEPLLAPSDVLAGVGASAPDLPELFAAAHLWGDEPLLKFVGTRLLEEAAQQGPGRGEIARAALAQFPSSPRPYEPTLAPVLTTKLVLAALLEAPRVEPLTWLASLAFADDEDWAAFLLAADQVPDRGWRPVHPAFLALGSRRPDRLLELMGSMSGPSAEAARSALRLLGVFDEAKSGPLHPEIEQVRRAVSPKQDEG